MGVLSRLTSMIRRALASVSYPLALVLSRIILARVYPYAFMNLLYYNVQTTYKTFTARAGGCPTFCDLAVLFPKGLCRKLCGGVQL